MESADSVRAFDEAGALGGPLVPIHLFNAAGISRLVPRGGVVLDLACGSGRFLGALLSGRPDLRAIGVDLSSAMLALAERNLAERGLLDRVELIQGGWAEADQAVTGKVDAVSCLSALHHCPTRADLVAALSAVARIRQVYGAAVWLFDLVRPEQEDLLELIPRSYEAASGRALAAAFKQDWITSLHAGWTLDEFRSALAEAGLEAESHEASYSQLHRLPRVGAEAEPIGWFGPEPAPADRVRAGKMARAFGLDLFTDPAGAR